LLKVPSLVNGPALVWELSRMADWAVKLPLVPFSKAPLPLTKTSPSPERVALPWLTTVLPVKAGKEPQKGAEKAKGGKGGGGTRGGGLCASRRLAGVGGQGNRANIGALALLARLVYAEHVSWKWPPGPDLRQYRNTKPSNRATGPRERSRGGSGPDG